MIDLNKKRLTAISGVKLHLNILIDVNKFDNCTFLPA